MKALKVEPGKKPEIVNVGSDLESLQKAVGGYIELIYPFDDDVGLVCNEEGKIAGLPLNRALYDEDHNLYDVVSGTFLIVGTPPTSEEFESLTDKQIETYMEMYQVPEEFVRINKKITAIPMAV